VVGWNLDILRSLKKVGESTCYFLRVVGLIELIHEKDLGTLLVNEKPTEYVNCCYYC
jgi:hypothetical protein